MMIACRALTNRSERHDQPRGVLLAFLLVVAAMITSVGLPAFAADAGLNTQVRIARNPGYPNRVAILVVPMPAHGSSRMALSHADEVEYRGRLRELGFDVHTVGPGTRPELDRYLRDVISRVESGTDVAVFVLGDSLAHGGDVYLVPGDAKPDIASRPDLLISEGISLADALRRVSNRTPRTLIVVIDECRLANGGDGCPVDALLASGANVLAPFRPRGASRPSTYHRSGAAQLIALMAREGLSLSALASRWSGDLRGSDLAVATSPRLSDSFSFLPGGYLAGIEHACNRVNPEAAEASIRRLPTDANVSACQDAERIWPYAPHFSVKRRAAVEQHAFRQAVENCANLTPANAYVANYPGGRFIATVRDFLRRCEAEAAARIPAPSPLPPLPAATPPVLPPPAAPKSEVTVPRPAPLLAPPAERPKAKRPEAAPAPSADGSSTRPRTPRPAGTAGGSTDYCARAQAPDTCRCAVKFGGRVEPSGRWITGSGNQLGFHDCVNKFVLRRRGG